MAINVRRYLNCSYLPLPPSRTEEDQQKIVKEERRR